MRVERTIDIAGCQSPVLKTGASDSHGISAKTPPTFQVWRTKSYRLPDGHTRSPLPLGPTPPIDSVMRTKLVLKR